MNELYNQKNKYGQKFEMGMMPVLLADFYKESHREFYPEDTEFIYNVFTPRHNTYAPYTEEVVVFGAQYFVERYLIELFNQNFFDMPKEFVTVFYERFIKNTLFREHVELEHIEKLHDVGYLPLDFRAIEEGTKVPFGVPIFSMENTLPEFFWLPNFLETLLSNATWKMMTSATLAYSIRKTLNKYAIETTGSTEGVNFQGHDFSMRGMGAPEVSMLSGAGHLLSFNGTDTMPAITFLERYYNADIEKEIVGSSIRATEHSVMSAGTLPDGDRDEYDTFYYILDKTPSKEPVAIVSDTYDFWGVVTELLPRLKEKIMSRESKTVIRPDSGDPVDILCGIKTDKTGEDRSPEEKGLVECLWETFGGTVNEQGYKMLDSHIGAIYGDSITLERATLICERLKEKGFASLNVVYGIGSYSYEYSTRDTLGFAVKATAGVRGGKPVMLFKDPKTDSKKRSHRGRIHVFKNEYGEVDFKDGYLSQEDIPMESDLLKPLFKDGKLLRESSLSEIRERLNK